ncbi:peptidyl-tRNA hydrolase ICT1, mitochondrial-like [Branchiostoma floridae]|uniref:Large ribosomal subunit protein mL62 n=1 Tax=Branchiostoma floridae TaxID=7739 RepID=A0A9J7N8I2_BRAFL|nr:peptidyl-tRNA hydrolase ICT1, mitochondrial-like [Branchiostoma floridae]
MLRRSCCALFRLHRGSCQVPHISRSSTYKSVYSLDRLYPDSDPTSFLKVPEGAYSTRSNPDKFDGHIPVDKLKISYSKSSGAGGQHVNKVNTKVDLRFHVESADWLPEDVRQKLTDVQKSRINKEGELIIKSEVSRFQMRNLADALKKLREMIEEVNKKPQEPSKEDRNMWRLSVENANRERLRQKKIRQQTKRDRAIPVDL